MFYSGFQKEELMPIVSRLAQSIASSSLKWVVDLNFSLCNLSFQGKQDGGDQEQVQRCEIHEGGRPARVEGRSKSCLICVRDPYDPFQALSRVASRKR